MDVIKIGRVEVNKKYLSEVTEEEAVSTLSMLPKTEVIRCWKMVNGKSTPKPRPKETEEKTED